MSENFKKNARDPFSSYSHLIGALFAAFGLVLMLIKSARNSTPTIQVVSSVIFCCSMIALYLSSGIYHYSTNPETTKKLRKLDHSMIFVLIAGSYTPVLLKILPPPRSIAFVVALWVVAAIGITIKMFTMKLPRWVTTGLYLLMGWAILIDLPAVGNLPIGGIILLVLGGVSYTIGGVMYGLKKPNISKDIGFHEVFHLFILLGSLLHYFLVYFYII